jgi:hypothetical protein
MQQQARSNGTVADASSGRPAIEVDWGKFSRSLVMPVTHHLAAHPLLQLPSLIELGKRLEAKGRVRTHSSDAKAGTNFNEAPSKHPNQKSAMETLGDIANAKAWMSLLNVQSDDLYRTLVDEALDSVKPGIDRFDPGMCYRGGWIFVTSPNTVTPFHMDSEHNFILQIQGRKRIYVWDPSDTVVISERAREAFHSTHSRDLIKWQDEFKERAHKFDLEPGQGAYMPSTSPHMVENGNNPSVTVSFTYYTDFTRRQSLLYATRDQLRRLGINPPGVGALPALDEALHATVSRFRSGKNAIRQALGRRVQRSDAPYAIVRYT